MSAIRDLIVDALKGADHILLSLCVLASSFGLVLIYSASRYRESFHSLPMKQALCIGIGIVLYFVMSQLNIRVLFERWYIVVPLCVAFQLLVLVFPAAANATSGNRAWVDIPGIPFTIQPAEINKLFFTILLAGFVVYLQKRGDPSSFSSVVLLVLALGVPVGFMVVVTGDVGSCLIYVVIWLAMLWCAGIKKRWFALGLACVGAAGLVLWNILPDTNYMKRRILVVMDHSYDPQGVGFHQRRSLIAIRSGGLTGQGYLQGTITQSPNSNSLPERTTDFIFSSCAEEWGLVGCTVVLLVLAAIVLRCLYIGLTASDSFYALIAVGYSAMLLAQIVINVGVCLYVVPTIGLTLPFMSYGGSSIITNFVAMGILSGIQSRSLPNWLRDRSDIKWGTNGEQHRQIME
ncbi:MAG: FtsW/RodA/SpoVE family cell cycle protein [Clostridiales bacterium]|nr:FtsW/RodA/SpoVE family cell cycle protein [Clostridiales bacterium]